MPRVFAGRNPASALDPFLILAAALAWAWAAAAPAQSGPAADAAKLAEIAKDPEQWPKAVSVLAPSEVPLHINGKTVGSMKLAPGKEFELVGIEKGKLILAATGSTAIEIDAARTDFWRRYDEWQRELQAQRATEQPAAPSPAKPETSQSPAPAAASAPASRSMDQVGFGEKTPLKKRGTAELQQYLAYASERNARLLYAPPEGIKNAPDVKKPLYFSAKIGGRDVFMLMDADNLGRARLLVDVDGSGDLAKAKVLSASNEYTGESAERYGYYKFGDAEIQSSAAEGKVPLEIEFKGRVYTQNSSTPGYLEVAPACHWEGKTAAGPRKLLAAVTDASNNGRIEAGFTLDLLPYNQRSSDGDERPGYDLLALDLDGNERFDYRGEILPLTPLLALAGKFFQVNSEPDASTLLLQEVRMDAGKLKPESPHLELAVLSRGCCGYLDAGAKDGWDLAPGTYQIGYYRLRHQAGGADWTLNGASSGNSRKIEIRPGAAVATGVGSGLRAKVDVDWRGNNTAYIEFTLEDKEGQTYEAGARRNNERQSAPIFTILNRDGKKIESGKFEYG